MVRIIEFGTFTCSFCRSFAASIDTVQRRYPGLVSLRWMHFLQSDSLQGNAYFLAQASECAAAQGGFERFYRTAFLTRANLDSRSALIASSDKLGISNRSRFVACLDAGSPEGVLKRHAAATRLLDTDGTPSWYLNSKLYVGSVTTRQLDSLVRAAMKAL